MNKMTVECFEKETAAVNFTRESGYFLEIMFTENIDGYLILGSLSERISGNSCVLNLTRLADGEYTPKLILLDRALDLPSIVKECGGIYLSMPDPYAINEFSLKQKRQEKMIKLLESRIKELENKVLGSTIF